MNLPIYDYSVICKSCSKRVCVCALIAMVMLHDGVISEHVPVCPYDLHFVSVAPPDVDDDED